MIRTNSPTGATPEPADPSDGTAGPSLVEGPVTELVDLIRSHRVAVLTGAGCSTESGIPDYRGPEGRFRAREPMRYQEFMGSAEARRRYWARSAVGWTRFAAARPNPAHEALARLEGAGVITGVITQNVDRLHHEAGSREVVELHGALARVRCLDCDRIVERASLQERILEMNPDFREMSVAPAAKRESDVEGESPDGGPRSRGDGEDDVARIAPDGDADVRESAVTGFRVPECLGCGGVLKPDVVFFGETVPPSTVEAAWRLYESSDLLLVVGSSLAVYSGRRFAYRAEREGVPVAVVNLGRTRADEMARLKVEGKVGEVLPRVADHLLGDRRAAG
ncbi:MAG: Sir2 family NAD-dependent protein deacetylase [Longimicrobiales bacterium]|nr:Sir2 family NAD-dependent protein deacetylase [Longimicrobiales bacterium]